MASNWTDVMIALATACGIAVVVIVLGQVATRMAVSRWPAASALAETARTPFRLLVLVLAVNGVLGSSRPESIEATWWGWAELAWRILAIVASAWLLTSVLLFLQDLGLAKYRTDVPDNRTARRMRTQVLIIRRLTVAVVVVIALGAVLLSFPGVEAIGASVLASAGLISIVAGLAAQSTLGNLIAGLQVAFSDAIRLDDVVIVENEWGWIEEITLSYVVVRLWDDRRLVLPSTYFTTTPFQNWTRRSSELLGAVELDLDWRVDTDGMRGELDRILEETDLWDNRVKVLQVTDAVGGWVRVRVLVTAEEALKLFDLRCLVRERLITWLQKHNERGMPRQRVEMVQQSSTVGSTSTERDHAGLFSGDEYAEERAARFGRTQAVEDRAERQAESPQGTLLWHE
ncbi:MAG: mechanosensitive ion channel family protein [Nocardioidaceae bacterium]